MTSDMSEGKDLVLLSRKLHPVAATAAPVIKKLNLDTARGSRRVIVPFSYEWVVCGIRGI